MLQDPIYAKIEERLAGHLDHEVFELCAVDLLRPVYPGLVPIRGGDDAGMDGAIPTDGPRLPLVTTTSSDVIGNLTRNLERYRERGGEAQAAVVATSERLTGRRQQNLEDRAQEFGFVLRGIHDGDDFALQLHGNPQWRRKLLGIPGDLPALSTVPRSPRPWGDLRLLGRDEETNWLREGEGDLALFGQPGSGKTAVLLDLALEGEGLFVVTDDVARIADGVRELQPPLLFLDDAHRNPELLLKLRRVREEMEAEFRIVATAWPSEEDRARVLGNLSIPESASLELSLLPRKEIAEVIQGAGLTGGERLIGEIVDQAAGRPGLAVTLARLCLRDGVGELVEGKFLLRDIRRALTEVAGEGAIATLGVFALGGRAGVPVQAVAGALDKPIDDAWELVTRVAAGGILRQMGHSTLAVVPEVLRAALLRAVFFEGPPTLPVGDFLDVIQDWGSAAAALARAKLRDVEVPDPLVQHLLEVSERRCPPMAYRNRDAWETYAYSGPEAVEWLLDRHPEHLGLVSRPALIHRPSRAIPLLLTAAVGDERKLQSAPDHPLRRIEDWVRSAPPSRGMAVERRYALLDSLVEWADRADADADVILRSVRIVFDPEYRSASTDPITRENLTLRSAYLTPDELDALMDRWPAALELISAVGLRSVDVVDPMVRRWAFPTGRPGAVTDESREAAKAGAARMLAELVAVEPDSLGVMAWARRMADVARLDVDLDGRTDPDFEILCPSRHTAENFRARLQQQTEAARELGERWAADSPDEVAQRLAHYEREADRGKLRPPHLAGQAALAIVEAVVDPVPWIRSLVDAKASAHLVHPFLQTVRRERSGLRDIWTLLSTDERYRQLLVETALRMEDPPTGIESAAFDWLEGREQIVETLCLRDEVPIPTLQKLLTHSLPGVAAAAAEGLWGRRTEEGIPSALHDAWRGAVVKHVKSHHVLKDVFATQPDIATDWIRARIDEDPLSMNRMREMLSSAADALDRISREALIEELPEHVWPSGFLRRLVAGDTALYRSLLDRDDLESIHLDPLEGRPSERWIALARTALDAGYSPESVAKATRGYGMTWSGNESKMWRSWVKDYAILEEHDDPRIEEVGRIGREWAEAQVEAAQRREHREAVTGLLR